MLDTRRKNLGFNQMTEKLANPAPLGLLGFGLTTILLNLHNAGFFALNSMILAMGLALGGFAQVLAGLMEFKKGNTFGTTAFTSYGLFNWSFVMLLLLPRISGFESFALPVGISSGSYFLVWGIFTLAMFVGTLKKNRALQFVFFSLGILFVLLALRDFFGSALIGTVAGYEGIICGASALYLAIAEVLNETHEKEVLPIGTVG